MTTHDEELLALARVLARTENERQALEDDFQGEREARHEIVQAQGAGFDDAELCTYRGQLIEAISKCVNGVEHDHVPTSHDPLLLTVKALREAVAPLPNEKAVKALLDQLHGRRGDTTVVLIEAALAWHAASTQRVLVGEALNLSNAAAAYLAALCPEDDR